MFDFGDMGSSLLVVDMNTDFSDAERGPDALTFVKVSGLAV